MTIVTRFAPSPNGWLHLGHALSAFEVWARAAEDGGEVRLRIEDIDQARTRADYEAAIFDDLRWLGLPWNGQVWRQSERRNHYLAAQSRLQEMDLIYPCFCTRRDIRDAADEKGFEGPIYPGTCRQLAQNVAHGRLAAGEAAAWRLKLDEALHVAGDVAWIDERAGAQRWDGTGWGDVVIARKDIGTSYHIAVTVDDAAQDISHVVRGVDLFEATHIHVLLQRLLDLSTPIYRHHPVILGDDGVKLSKSRESEGLRDLSSRIGGKGALMDLLARSGAPLSTFDHVPTVTTPSDE